MLFQFAIIDIFANKFIYQPGKNSFFAEEIFLKGKYRKVRLFEWFKIFQKGIPKNKNLSEKTKQG